MKNIKQIIFFCLFLFFSALSVFAQNTVIDSLQNELKNDKEFAETLFQIAVEYSKEKKHKQAIEYYNKAEKSFADLNNSTKVVDCINEAGICYFFLGEYENATNKYFKALKIAEKLKLKLKRGQIIKNIGSVYLRQDKFEEALKHYLEALKFYNNDDYQHELSNLFNNIALAYVGIENYDEAENYYLKSAVIKRKLNDIKGIAGLYVNIGNMFLNKDIFDKALIYYKKALIELKNIDDKNIEASAYVGIGEVKFLQKKYSEGISNYKIAIKIAAEIDSKYILSNSYWNLAEYYAGKEDYKSAYQYFHKFYEVYELLIGENTSKKIEELKAKYQNEKKEKQIAVLNSEKEKQEFAMQKQKTITYIIAISLIVFIFLLVLAFRGYKLKQKANKLLFEKNKKIEDQKYEITTQNIQLANQTKKLKELDKIKSNFFANISHEFRTPLTLIAGPVEQLIQKNSYPEIKIDLEMVYRHSKRLKQLIDQLLDISKIERGALQLKVAKADLTAFTRTLVNTFHSFAEENKIDLQFESEENYLFCLFDKDKIEKIIGNLITNAVKFTPSGGKVVVRLKTKDKKANIEVEDTGKGISKDNQKLIFERFYRSEEHNSIGGTGIGLSLVKELVTLHKGDIFVESIEGK